MNLYQALGAISQLDRCAMAGAGTRLDKLTKPLGSLGKLEEIVKQLAGITGEVYPRADMKAIVIMCSDNGVVEEGVSSCPGSVTASVTRNFTRGITGVNIFSSLTGAELVIVDMGVNAELEYGSILNRKIRKGTWNIARGPAMTRAEAVQAMECGIEIVEELKDKGINLLGTGEMGIGNTTTSSAISCALAGFKPDEMVGQGAGLSKQAFENKKQIVKKAIELNKPDPSDPIDVVAKLGGFDIAGLTGCFIGAAACRLPILVDGFISSAAALAAVKLHPGVRDYIIPSHGSAEPGSRLILQALKLEPLLNLEMRLGEGTGAALAFQLIDAAIAAYTRMGTFDDAGIEQYKPQD